MITLAKRHLICLALLTSARTVLAASLSGTEVRPEIEYKSAYEGDQSHVSDDNLNKKLSKALKSVLREEVFLWPQMLGYPSYEADLKFKDFIFQDTYFDTDDLAVLKTDSSYRLRYRFNPSLSYYKFLLVPHLGFFQPSRVEIQAKTGYRVENELMIVNETRFEFRNESLPFSVKKDAPPPPWPEDEYSQYAITGRYQSYDMLPYAELKRHIEARNHVLDLTLQPRFKLITTRYRSHLSLTNPWGKPPNERQVIIITLDRTKAECIAYCPARAWPDFYEIEVEIDRNILTTLDEARKISGEDLESQVIRRHSDLFYQKLHADQEKLFSQFRKALHKVLPIKKLPPQSKYARWHHWLYPAD